MGLFEKGRDAGDLARQDGRRFRTGLGAFLLPLAYCLIDTLGTFLDDPCLNMDTTWLVNVTEETIEDVGNTAYELTFLLVAVILIIYLLATKKKAPAHRPELRYIGARGLAAVFETAGQYAYAHVIGGAAVVTAPMVGSYCVVSVILSRLILKEKLPKKQYLSILITLAGIILLGLAEGLAE